MHTVDGNDPARRVIVGFKVAGDAGVLPTGAHIVTNDVSPKSIGIITSSYDSPSLGHPIAMGLLADGQTKMGEKVAIWHLGKTVEAEVVSPCFYDISGENLHA